MLAVAHPTTMDSGWWIWAERLSWISGIVALLVAAAALWLFWYTAIPELKRLREEVEKQPVVHVGFESSDPLDPCALPKDATVKVGNGNRDPVGLIKLNLAVCSGRGPLQHPHVRIVVSGPVGIRRYDAPLLTTPGIEIKTLSNERILFEWLLDNASPLIPGTPRPLSLTVSTDEQGPHTLDIEWSATGANMFPSPQTGRIQAHVSKMQL